MTLTRTDDEDFPRHAELPERIGWLVGCAVAGDDPEAVAGQIIATFVDALRDRLWDAVNAGDELSDDVKRFLGYVDGPTGSERNA